MSGWRKWSLAAAALVFAFVLGLLGKLTTEFASVVSVIITATAAANTFEHKYAGSRPEAPPISPT